jgi:iron-sulfur cluster repair protein YtfE (RIC family)
MSVGNYVANYYGVYMEKEKAPITNAELDEHLEEHQDLLGRIQSISESLVANDPSEALASFKNFVRILNKHAANEEDRLLPVYSALGDIPRTGREEYFLDEHRRIEAEIENLSGDLSGLSLESASPTEVVDLVERLGRLRNLLEHHFRREETTLFPRLKEVLL